MMQKFSLATWSTRNPLGIIALFISLIYAMSAVLLSTSVTSLTETNQTILVFFIVTFPFVVLSVFGWLVAKHHRKLYGPGDFRSDEGFLNSESPSSPSTLGQRLRREIELSREETRTAQSETQDAGREATSESGSDVGRVQADAPILRAYLAENLVFQELQNEFSGAVKRNLKLQTPTRAYEVDGIIQTANETIVVETMLARSSKSVLRLVGKVKEYFGEFSGAPRIRLLLVIIEDYEGTEKVHRQIENELRGRLGDNYEIRIYSLAELIAKYGLATPQTRLGRI